MRPQSGIVGPVDGKEAAANLEDLGWNDMGEAQADLPAREAEDATEAKAPPENVVAIAPQAANERAAPNHVRTSLDRIQAQLDSPLASVPRRAALPQRRASARPSRCGSTRNAI